MTPSDEHAIAAVRERTGVGYLDALAALREHAWRVDAAVDYLRRHVVRCANADGDGRHAAKPANRPTPVADEPSGPLPTATHPPTRTATDLIRVIGTTRRGLG